MTFADAIARLAVTVDRTDLADQYVDFLNKAVRETAVRHSWDQMKATTTLTIGVGASSAALPATFKEFQNGRFCATANGTPISIFTRTELERLLPIFRPASHLVFTQDNSAFTLTLPAAAAVSQSILVYYFAYPAEVTVTSNTTPLLYWYPNLILSKAQALAFQTINDPVYKVHEDQYEKLLALFATQDVASSMPAPRGDKE